MTLCFYIICSKNWIIVYNFNVFEYFTSDLTPRMNFISVTSSRFINFVVGSRPLARDERRAREFCFGFPHGTRVAKQKSPF